MSTNNSMPASGAFAPADPVLSLTRTRRRIRPAIGVVLLTAFILVTPGLAAAKVVETGTSCTGERDCSELARLCQGHFVAVVGTTADGTRTIWGWCQEKKSPRILGCNGALSCSELKKLCIAAHGLYTEYTTSTQVTGTCKLPAPKPKEPRDNDKAGEVELFCLGTEDCAFLAGFCAGQGGEFTPGDPIGGAPTGECTYTPTPQ